MGRGRGGGRGGAGGKEVPKENIVDLT
jgi:hypothetical protein